MTNCSDVRIVKILALSGSARQGSFNQQLLAVAAHKARALGAEVTVLDLRELGLPVFDADLMSAQGIPAGAVALRNAFAAHDGLLLASPEYNALPTPLFINAFDWLSVVQAADGQPGGTASTAGKPVGLLAASPGALGGIRALPIVRTYLSTNFAMAVVPEQLALPSADQHLGDDTQLKTAPLDQMLDKVVGAVVQHARWRLA